MWDRWIGLGLVILLAGCGGGEQQDAGGSEDATTGSCAGAADGAACGSGRICLGESCVVSRCGDGFLDTGAGERCDDGNEIAFDGCEPGTCQLTCEDAGDCDDGVACNGAEVCSEAHQCAAGTSLPDGTECDRPGGAGVCRTGECVVEGCGDGLVTGDERCDDGNDVDGDGCETDCRFTCEVDTSASNTWHLDCDADGFAADGAQTEVVCLPPAAASCGGGWTLRAPAVGARDCDDTQSDTHPGATEVCDDVDQDCDGMVDEGLLSTFYRDADADGYGDADTTTTACTLPDGHVTNDLDCDDDCETCHPDGTETCDTRDNDCDGMADEGVRSTFYRDADGDTFGAASVTTMACAAPSGYVANDDDCDDSDSAARPNQTAYFTRQRNGGGYDFNCDGVSSRQYTTTAPPTCSCACPTGFCCSGQCVGWQSSVPGCGDTGTWRETSCTCVWGSASRTQPCR